MYIEKEKRVASDIIRRSKAGIWSYTIVWLLVSLDNDFYLSKPVLFWSALIAFLILAIARTWHNSVSDTWLESKPELWTKLQFLLVPMSAFIWGLLYSYSLFLDNQSFAVIMAVCIIGFSAGGASSTAPNKYLAYTFISVSLLPPTIATLYLQEVVLMVMVLAFWAYQLKVAQSSNYEYETLLDNERRLEQQQEQLMALSQVDSLTGLSNRRHFDKRMDEIWKFCGREKIALSLLVIDIDHFKKVNDKHGHLVGDECLKHVAKIISNIVKRDTDIVARFGGEEFVALISSSEIEMGRMIAERIRSEIEASPLIHDIHEINITVSIGIASEVPSKQADPYSLFEQADKAMYEAKNHGRNQCR